MTSPPTVDDLRADGLRQFAEWDAALFDAVAAGPAADLAARLGDEPDGARVVGSYLRLAQQAVGTGLLRRAGAGPGGWTTFLERLVVDLVPRLLPAAPPAERVRLLADAWNVGEGLAREPAWVDRYVAAFADGLTALDGLADFLVRTLEPVLAAAPPASWAGAFRVTVLDLRAVRDDFLPGRVRLAAPAVACVEDRRRPEVQAAVVLRPGGASAVLGAATGLGEYAEPGPAPAVAFADGRATVAGREVAVPTLRRCQGFAVARAGFVAASAADSQRLWVIECN